MVGHLTSHTDNNHHNHNHHQQQQQHNTIKRDDIMNGVKQVASSRILVDVPCKVCHDNSSGKHYGIFACDGCAGFFKRSIRRNRQYVCKNRGQGGCPVDKTHRNQCRSCRLKKCMEVGMNRDAVQHERGPRNSTIRRQMALLMKESNEILTSVYRTSPTLYTRYMPPMVPNSSSRSNSINLKSYTDHTLMLQSSSASTSPSAAAISPTPPPLLPPHPVPPSQQAPPLAPNVSNNIFNSLNTAESVCETAARLLFMCVRWAKSIPAFVQLDLRDQLALLEDGWRENFLLSSAQFQMQLDLAPLLANANLNSETCSHERLVRIMSEVRNFQDLIEKFKHTQVDATEFACLKAMTLFKTHIKSTLTDTHTYSSSSASSTSSLNSSDQHLLDPSSIQAFQEQTQLTLSKYTASAYPSQPFRFGKLLLLIPLLRGVSSCTIEELFFKKTIGNISIEKVILDMYKSQITNM